MEIVRCGDSPCVRPSARRQHPAGALAVAACAAMVAALVLIGPGAVLPAEAGSLTIGAGSTMQLGDALVNMGCNDLIVAPGGTLDAQASTLSSVPEAGRKHRLAAAFAGGVADHCGSDCDRVSDGEPVHQFSLRPDRAGLPLVVVYQRAVSGQRMVRALQRWLLGHPH